MPALFFPVGTKQTVSRDPYVRDFSGVILNQNAPVTAQRPGSHIPVPVRIMDASPVVYQTFTLPSNYARGGEMIPSLTGFNLYVNIDGDNTLATLRWQLDMYVDGTGWIEQVSGTTTGCAVAGEEVWFEVYFDKSLSLSAEELTSRFRLGVEGDLTNLISFWFSSPNPLVATFDKAYSDSNVPLVGPDGGDLSLMFRVLADTADSGTDFLGNPYRSAVVRSSTAAVEATGDRDQYWLSAPQPSKFAVVNQYFDLSQDGEAVVIDSILVDPTTPGVYFHVYYSSDGDPGTSPDEWDEKLWTPIPQAFQMTTRTSHYLPKPITTKYVKIEYSHLQAKYYSAGEFQKPMIYKKHPKWVTDYFLARILARNSEDPLIARRVQVVYDALDFAYNYYTDDVTSAPDNPTTADELAVLRSEDQQFTADPETLSRIALVFQPYLNRPALLGRSDYLLGQFLANSVTGDYPTEQIDRSRAAVDEVISLEREPVIVEKSYPVMFFYLTARHGYRVAASKFDRDRAYFVGVNEIAFTRDRYDARTDSDLYIESTGDLVNVQRNDFETVDFTWVTYRDA
jgi:hypothetical protein